MGLEDEARQQVNAKKAADAEREAKEREQRILEATPAPPEWTAELIAIIEQRFPDQPVYRVVRADTVYEKPYTITTHEYEPLGSGWGLHAHYSYYGWEKVDREAVLLRDGNLYSGSSRNTRNTATSKHLGLPDRTETALVAEKLLTHVGAIDSWRELYGLGAATAMVSSEVQYLDGVLSWYDANLRE
ncbi:hypothetical protein Achl_3960 (plasmid) [Pseudarthrobacter chlorophenolicus A6]|uniref:Uncharacterized protein n=1 Tax=Pseudarthrobacter chlorophenolicus (strain ATCC 700700 / DSM 12829 / CIP 107037 / JCM 12360 / KCTC 9906 / NCIMB 13794 / A6) TaxID=452863 RepID=B8HHL4_PSECP|nr:hypothetical protein [Pseudarthrobacter chlorophenolicus]ACL41911.1 hypothetical protein Achl_3960 [Pseudarthrobacter chlorophenolicus A6]SDQ18556.1 hypothetical protein SAMN04489738_0571 [Pseudarthrobacter chlorophenolicus]